MNIVKHDPWNIFQQLQHDVNQVFDTRSERDGTSATSDWTPTVDIEEFDDKFVLLADIPGVDPKDIELSLENGTLILHGERKSETSENTDLVKRRERVYGQFYRRFVLPDTANTKDVTARGNNGVLEIVIPKAPTAKPRKIKIQ